MSHACRRRSAAENIMVIGGRTKHPWYSSENAVPNEIIVLNEDDIKECHNPSASSDNEENHFPVF
jgi:hypothetical protein